MVIRCWLAYFEYGFSSMYLSRIAASVLATLIVAGCATKPKPDTSLNVDRSITTSSYQSDSPLDPIKKETVKDFQKPEALAKRVRPSSLTGRTLRISSIRDIKLKPKEVVLTFDDGPAPGKTERILKALDDFNVKATFLMVGEMARAHPKLARKVVARGHSVGSHTYGHANLSKQSFDVAIKSIRRGERALRAAGIHDVKFFRFPYLADTQALRSHLGSRGTVVLDADIDSKDYFKVSPETVVSNTMKRLRTRGKGIILMHDLHNRTAVMLPSLLRRLKNEGYKVVFLKPAGGSSDAVASLN